MFFAGHTGNGEVDRHAFVYEAGESSRKSRGAAQEEQPAVPVDRMLREGLGGVLGKRRKAPDDVRLRGNLRPRVGLL